VTSEIHSVRTLFSTGAWVSALVSDRISLNLEFNIELHLDVKMHSHDSSRDKTGHATKLDAGSIFMFPVSLLQWLTALPSSRYRANIMFKTPSLWDCLSPSPPYAAPRITHRGWCCQFGAPPPLAHMEHALLKQLKEMRTYLSCDCRHQASGAVIGGAVCGRLHCG